MLKIISLSVCFTIIFSSCNSSESVTSIDYSSNKSTSISLQFAKPSSIGNLVVSAKIIISAIDIDTINADLSVTDTTIFGVIENIPAGKERTFTICCYNDNMELTYKGEKTIDIISGTTHTLSLVLYPLNYNGTVIITGTFSRFPQSEGKIVFQADYSGSYDIYIMNPDASNLIQLTNSIAEDIYPQISPLRDQIIFCRRENGMSRPFVMDIDGKNLKQLDILPGVSIGYCSWSPDAKKLVLHADKDGDSDIFIHDISNNSTVQIVFNSSIDWIPDWSPDGNKIAFYSNMSGLFRIYIVDINGENLELLTDLINTEERAPKYSPDGSEIVMMGRNRYAQWGIFKVDSAGSKFFEVTNTNGIDEQLACWSPTGEKILFERKGDNYSGYGLYKINSDGSDLEELLDTEYNERNSHWR